MTGLMHRVRGALHNGNPFFGTRCIFQNQEAFISLIDEDRGAAAAVLSVAAAPSKEEEEENDDM